LKNSHSALYNRVKDTGDLNDADDKELGSIIQAYVPESGLAMK